MQTPSYRPVRFHLALRGAVLAILLVAAAPLAARMLSFGTTDLLGPRLSTGDLDGNGSPDAAVVGTIDTSPGAGAHAGPGRIDWYGGAGVTSLAVSQAADVTHADLDGDGRDELIVVGPRGWQVLKLEPDGLQLQDHGFHGAPLWRVAAGDIDADGTDELAIVSLQRGLVDEVPTTLVELVRLTPTAGLQRLDAWEIAAHVGDICFAPSALGPVLIVESGAEEVGGRLHRLSTTAGLLRQQDTARTGGENLRILSLSALATEGRTLLSLTDISGRVRLVEWRSHGLQPAGHKAFHGAGAALSVSAAGRTDLWLVPRQPGAPINLWTDLDLR